MQASVTTPISNTLHVRLTTMFERNREDGESPALRILCVEHVLLTPDLYLSKPFLNEEPKRKRS